MGNEVSSVSSSEFEALYAKTLAKGGAYAHRSGGLSRKGLLALVRKVYGKKASAEQLDDALSRPGHNLAVPMGLSCDEARKVFVDFNAARGSGAVELSRSMGQSAERLGESKADVASEREGNEVRVQQPLAFAALALPVAVPKTVGELREPLLRGAWRLELLETGEEVEKLALPPLSNDLQRYLLSFLCAADVARLGAVSRSFYRLTRHDAVVWEPRIRALAAAVQRTSLLNAENREEIAMCAAPDPKRSVSGFSGHLLMQWALFFCESRKVCRALYDYKGGTIASFGDLSLAEGKTYVVVSEDLSGWWRGVDEHGTEGWLPSNYCEMIEQSVAAHSGALVLQAMFGCESPAIS